MGEGERRARMGEECRFRHAVIVARVTAGWVLTRR